MKITYKDILSKHAGHPCVIALHGPSLSKDKDKIENFQKTEGLIRFSVNEWFDFFNIKPDYWVVSNGEFNIKSSIVRDSLWETRKYPHNVFNEYDVPLLYNCTADLTDKDFVRKNLTCDYLEYDTRHFQNKTCQEILYDFKKYYEQNRNLDYLAYGNNSQMWQKPNVNGFPDWFKRLHGKIAGGWSTKGVCCHQKTNITLQEKLQEVSGHSQHASPGQTVGLFAVMLAVIMGCNPVYITGLDLDYTLGYADSSKRVNMGVNIGNVGHWKHAYRDFLLSDMKIIRESAELLGTNIINLNKESWYDTFTKGDLVL